ncbi:MAG: hypothetical protein AAFV93_22965, partial [Chloroflexota bacterium]
MTFGTNLTIIIIVGFLVTLGTFTIIRYRKRFNFTLDAKLVNVSMSGENDPLPPSAISADMLDSLEDFLKSLNLNRGQISSFKERQLDAYHNVWRQLHKMRLAGNALWEKASNENIRHFENEYSQTRNLVFENEVF